MTNKTKGMVKLLRIKSVFLIALLFLFVTSCKEKSLDESDKLPKVGEKAPNFIIKDIKGETYHSKKLKGKVVVINFWTSNDDFCIERLLTYKDLSRIYYGAPFVFLGINVDAELEIEEAKEIIKKYNFNWPQITTREREHSAIWQTYSKLFEDPSILPLIVVIDRDGNIRYAGTGGEKFEKLYGVLSVFSGHE